MRGENVRNFILIYQLKTIFHATIYMHLQN